MRRGPSITALLIGIATVPAFVMFLVVSTSMYASRMNEVQADIDERGRLLAAALANSSLYGVVSGNVPALEASLQRLLTTDASIAGLQILDAQRHAIASVGPSPPNPAAIAFEHPINVQAIDVDLLDGVGPPHGAANGAPKAREGALVGYSKVLMSPEPLLKAKRNGLLIAGMIVLIAALLSAILGVALSQLVQRPLAGVMAALRAIQKGDFGIALPQGRKGELGELEAAIIDMSRELSTSRQALEDKVARRTAELEEAVKAARAADDEKRRLIAHGNVLIEEERRRIAAEIHDQMNASLISIRLLAASLTSRDGTAPTGEDVSESADRIARTAEDLYESARRIVKQLRPEVLDMLGLRKALAEMVRHYDEMHPSCRFEFLCVSDFPKLPDSIAITIYRIAQEALSNIVKHAGATAALVSLALEEDGQSLVIAVSDNGRGLDPGIDHARLGLIGMRERAAAAGGTLLLTSNPSGGTTVEARFAWAPGQTSQGRGPTAA